MTAPLIVALDVATTTEALELVRHLAGRVSFFKVGMELYAAGGPAFVKELVAEGKDVFLDLKFYDIPETVKRATAQVAGLGVRFLTIHGSAPVMSAAVEAKAGSELRLLAVTVLTSFDQQDLADLGYPCPVSDLVDLRVTKAGQCGVDGVVCSPLEVRRVRQIAGPRSILVTPGVRSAHAAKGDQKRVATPAEAIRDGANYIVIGRQITRAADPMAEAASILNEIQLCEN